MDVGFWTVNSDGTGTISVDKTGAGYVTLNDFSVPLHDGSAACGVTACVEPTANSLEFEMEVGVWHVAPNGNGTISANKTGPSYVPLRDVLTISIRVQSIDFNVVACG